MHQKSALAAVVRDSLLLPNCGQAKEPSDPKDCRQKLRLDRKLVPPTVMHHAHSCHVLASPLGFLMARKQSWTPTLSVFPETVLAFAETVQNAASKQIPHPEAFNDIHQDTPAVVTAETAVWSLTTHSEEQARLLRVRGGRCLHPSQLLPEQFVESHSITPGTVASTTTGYTTASWSTTDWRWVEKQVFLLPAFGMVGREEGGNKQLGYVHL